MNLLAHLGNSEAKAWHWLIHLAHRRLKVLYLREHMRDMDKLLRGEKP